MEEKMCPKCGRKLARICYGLPSDETFEMAERKEIYLGGCLIGRYKYHCYPCDLSFTEDLSERMSTEI